MTSTRGPVRGRGRPKRQPKPPEKYSDDKEEERKANIKAGLITFPTKKKKNGEVSPPAAPSRQRNLGLFDEGLPQKRTYRRKKAYNRHEITSVLKDRKESVSDTESRHDQTGDVEPAPVTTSSPTRKRRRPAETSPTKSITSAPSKSGRKSKARGGSVKAQTTIEKPSWTSRLYDVEGTFLAHSVKLAPILPPTFETTQALDLEQKYPKLYGKGLGKDSLLEKPTWSPLYSPDVFFEEDYSSDDNRGLDPSVLPVTRSISCITTRKPDHQYMAVGDDAGFCIIYSMGTHIRPITRLETVACQQRSRAQQEKIRDQIRKSKGKLRSLVTDASETTINAIGMVGLRVVLATSCELECMDVPSQTSLWVCPLTPDRIVTSLDMHISTYDVLVSCNILKQQTNSVRQSTPLAQAPSSPLMLLQHSRNNIEICDANSPLLVKSPCCTAIWDASKSVENRLLFVAVSDTDQELELVLVQGGSIDNWKVACKTRIPVKASNHQTRICQSPEGIYTLVASSRGIRLYQTETLQLIHTYGDQLALHGKSVVWQDCLLMNSNQFRNKFNKVQENLLCDDWLCKKEGKDDGQGQSDLGPYIVGIPNFKGPKELTETLHIWKVEQATTVPAFSLPLPAHSEGVSGLVGAPIKGHHRLVLATRSGFGHTLIPRMESNFAGIMYPPGYHVVTDNLEYIEHEDELDTVERQTKASEDEEEEVDVLGGVGSEEMDDDLREAMRQSLLEKKLHDAQQAMKDDDVDLLNDDPESVSIIPCRPEPYLRQFVNKKRDGESDGENSSNEQIHEDAKEEVAEQAVSNTGPIFIEKILDSMPNVFKKKELSDDGITVTVTKVVVASVNPIPNRQGRGKRSRATNLEAMLKASIDPRVQKYMFARQNVWSDGSGSTLGYDQKDNIEGSECGSETNPVQVTPSPAAEKDDVTKNGTTNGVQVASKDHSERDLEERDTVYGSKLGTSVLSTNIRPDEAAVALGLLGLSPCNATGTTPEAPSSDGRAKSPSSFPDGSLHGSHHSNSVSSANVSETASRASSSNQPLLLNHVVYSAPETTAASSDMAYSTALSDKVSEIASNSLLVNLQSQAPKPNVNCMACRGRYVVHSCGKRAMPIDYDEVAKAEREKREKEEEEKKKARAEKRRLADARRREVRKQKQKDVEERRRREEEEERLERERVISLAEDASAKANVTLSQSMQSQLMGELGTSLYNTNTSTTYQQPVSQPAEATTYAIQLKNGTYSGPPISHNNWGTGEKLNNSADSRQGLAAEKLATSRQTSLGTLSSADALVALASFAGATAATPVNSRMESPMEQARSLQTYGGLESTVQYTAKHNFGGVPVASISDQPKLGIPSYASLGTQSNGTTSGTVTGGNDETKANFASASSAEPESNGSHSTTSYLWPPRSSVPQDSYPSSYYKS